MAVRVSLAGVILAPAIFLSGLLAADQSFDYKKQPLGLMPIIWPTDNPYSPLKAELGRLLFFDTRLSIDGTVSCATCHDPKLAFTDGLPVSAGVQGRKGNRSSPTVLNRAYSLAQFWDGRALSLEAQVLGPMANPVEMANSHLVIVNTLKSISGYRVLFAKVFGTENFDISHVAKAIATFERTIQSGNAPYDRYKAGNKNAMTPPQIHGMTVFFDKAKCDQCHEGINFTSNMYANLGVGTDKKKPDEGRYSVTKDPKDWGVFKTPTLREVERTAPYMHDGSLKTLEEVVDFYDKGGIRNRNIDDRMKKLNLTDIEKKDLVSFLKALSGEGWQQIKAPQIFPQ
jgi:cytochrome c peroxidase